MGDTHDYRRKRGIIHTEILLPPQSPAWASNRQQLWAAADNAEGRKNSTVARECVVALPGELDEDARKRTAVALARHLVDTYGVAADIAIHLPDKHTATDQRGSRNYHAHVLFTTRQVGTDGFGVKTRVLDAKQTGKDEISKIREVWQELLNAALARTSARERVDCRSHRDRGLDLIPQIHEGPADAPAHGRRRARNAEIRVENARRTLERRDQVEPRPTVSAEVLNVRLPAVVPASAPMPRYMPSDLASSVWDEFAADPPTRVSAEVVRVRATDTTHTTSALIGQAMGYVSGDGQTLVGKVVAIDEAQVVLQVGVCGAKPIDLQLALDRGRLVAPPNPPARSGAPDQASPGHSRDSDFTR
jgi:hypothetical protein